MFFHSFSLFVRRGSSSGKRILAASAFSATLAHRHGEGSPGRRCGRRQLPARRAAQQRLAAVPKGTSLAGLAASRPKQYAAQSLAQQCVQVATRSRAARAAAQDGVAQIKEVGDGEFNSIAHFVGAQKILKML